MPPRRLGGLPSVLLQRLKGDRRSRESAVPESSNLSPAEGPPRGDDRVARVRNPEEIVPSRSSTNAGLAAPMPEARKQLILADSSHQSLYGPYVCNEESIGEGSEGVVLEARHMHTGEQYVLKFSVHRHTENRKLLMQANRLQYREALNIMLLRTRHPVENGIVKLSGIFEAHGINELDFCHVLVFSQEPKDLHYYLVEEMHQPKNPLLLLRSILRDLVAMNRIGMVHRDIKPRNIFVREARNTDELESVVLGDFGMAVLTRDGRQRWPAQEGTSDYWSPEMIRDEYDPNRHRWEDEEYYDAHKADIWALGCVFYHVLTGVSAFRTHQILERQGWYKNNCDATGGKLLLWRNQEKGQRYGPRRWETKPLPRNIDERYGEILGYMLNEDPKQRYSAADLWDCIESKFPSDEYPELLPRKLAHQGQWEPVHWDLLSEERKGELQTQLEVLYYPGERPATIAGALALDTSRHNHMTEEEKRRWEFAKRVQQVASILEYNVRPWQKEQKAIEDQYPQLPNDEKTWQRKM